MMKLFSWFVLALFCLAIFLLSLFRFSIPLKGLQDPFFYFHLDMLKPIARYEQTQKSADTLKALTGQNISVAHVDVYDAVSDQLSKFEDSVAYPARIVPALIGQGCEDLRISLHAGATHNINAANLQTIIGNICRYKIDDVKFSDDLQTIAVQMQGWDNESDLVIQIFSLSYQQPRHIHTLQGRLKRPMAFAADNGVLYSSNRLDMLKDKKCRINKWLAESDSCILLDSDLPSAEVNNAMLLYRSKSNDRTWISFVHGTDDSGTVYEWSQSKAGNAFVTTGLENVSKLVATSKGVLYAKADSPAKKQLANEVQFFSYDQKAKSKLLATYPLLTTKFINKDDAFLVLSKNAAAEKFFLSGITEQGEHFYATSKQVQDAAAIEFLRNTNSRFPRLRLSASSGEISYGYVDQDGEFISEQKKNYPFKTDVQTYFGKSVDGTEVPCTMIRRAGLTRPLPAVVNVYAAYGVTLRPQFSAMQGVLYANEIASIYAHARGGGELGRKWAEEGRAIKKSNAIFDTEACINKAIEQQWIIAGKIVTTGTSAGAPIAMMVALRNPAIITGAWLDVPFLDTANIHHNDSIDDEEFGNLGLKEEVQARRQWSPYQNLLKSDASSASF
jgi:protease II